jgi:hypothetical protein
MTSPFANSTRLTRRAALAAVALPLFALPACEWDGHFTVLGYTTRPNYDCNVHTVRVPIFRNLTFYRGMEFELTRAVVREIELKTPYKVVGADCNADTELAGTIIMYNKAILNRNQLNEVREAETTLGVLLVWRDLRTGEVLSQPPTNQPPIIPGVPAVGPGDLPPPVIVPAPPGAPVPQAPLVGPPPQPGWPVAAPVLVQSVAGFIPELGETNATGRKKNVDRLAVQIVSMMEKPPF